MPNVSVSQIGQTAVNKPIFGVRVGNQRFVFTAKEGRAFATSPRLLKDLGVYSSVVETYSEPTVDLYRTMGLASDGSTVIDERFLSRTLGTGLAFVPEFSPQIGWVGLFSSFAKTFQV